MAEPELFEEQAKGPIDECRRDGNGDARGRGRKPCAASPGVRGRPSRRSSAVRLDHRRHRGRDRHLRAHGGQRGLGIRPLSGRKSRARSPLPPSAAGSCGTARRAATSATRSATPAPNFSGQQVPQHRRGREAAETSPASRARRPTHPRRLEDRACAFSPTSPSSVGSSSPSSRKDIGAVQDPGLRDIAGYPSLHARRQRGPRSPTWWFFYDKGGEPNPYLDEGHRSA